MRLDIFDKKATDYRTEITEKDREIFSELKGFLDKYNDEQKKAIVSDRQKILCVAGAGSGKTTVLTKRIEFLVKYRAVKPEKILAITFTRKARQEMMKRLAVLGIHTNVETFNSFCEKILKKHEKQVYGRETRMVSYTSKSMMVANALDYLGLRLNNVIDTYFTESQRENAEYEKLSNSFLSDCFFVLDYFKLNNRELYDFSKDAKENKEAARIIYGICDYIKKYMEMAGLRDFTDQLIDTIKFFNKNKETVPIFEHVLVDEYQDVNKSQIDFLDILNPANLFCVGDPRQSIFGWRGSDISYIMDFKEKYPEAEIVALTKNYRSSKHIVELINSSIEIMNLPELSHEFENQNRIFLKGFESEEEEHNFVVSEIAKKELPFDEIFVLARTNRQLTAISGKMREKGIPHIVKSDEINHPVLDRENSVTAATIHAIKGLEAEKVFVLGCNEQNFPCKATDHPAIAMLREEYDKEEEERRLFYVALSRAKNILYLTYCGKKKTGFINNKMLDIMQDLTEKKQASLSEFSGKSYYEKQNELMRHYRGED